MDRQKIGVLSEEVINLLSLPYASNSGIYISPGNIAHMKNKHPQDFEKYGADIRLLQAPLVEISSTTIRRRAENGLSIRYMVPDVVSEYIQSNALYKIKSE